MSPPEPNRTILSKNSKSVMSDTKVHEVAEFVFNRGQRRAAEIGEALKQEEARHAAVLKNMHRLRALRLARSAEHQSTKKLVESEKS